MFAFSSQQQQPSHLLPSPAWLFSCSPQWFCSRVSRVQQPSDAGLLFPAGLPRAWCWFPDSAWAGCLSAAPPFISSLLAYCLSVISGTSRSRSFPLADNSSPGAPRAPGSGQVLAARGTPCSCFLPPKHHCLHLAPRGAHQMIICTS